MNKWTLHDIPDLTGRVIIVTGGNSGLGYESVKAFVQKGAEVVLACRDAGKGLTAVKRIEAGSITGRMVVLELDLTDLKSIHRFAFNFKSRYQKLDVLMNNAGVILTSHFLTKDGFEGHMGTNHLGHFALTGLLLDLLYQTPGSRVVNVSSSAHRSGKMDFDNLLFTRENSFSRIAAYGRSKLSNLLFTYELQRFFEASKFDSIAVAAHPGGAITNFGRNFNSNLLVKILHPLLILAIQSAAQGALPQIRAAVDPQVKGGTFYGPSGFKEMKGHPVIVSSGEASHNIEDAKKLWEISENLTQVVF